MNEKPDYPSLVIEDGDFKGQQWTLQRDIMLIGREDTCDIVITNRQVSRQQARLRRIAIDQYEIEDLQSRNGTWVNGNKLENEPYIMSDGDEVHITLKVRLKFLGSGVTAPATEDYLPKVIPNVVGGRLKLDAESHRVFVLGEELDPPLSLPQYRLLELLYLNNMRVCTREEVVTTVWPEALGEGVSEQAIDALVRRLRDRLAEVDTEWQYITTVRGHGFRLENPPD